MVLDVGNRTQISPANRERNWTKHPVLIYSVFFLQTWHLHTHKYRVMVLGPRVKAWGLMSSARQEGLDSESFPPSFLPSFPPSFLPVCLWCQIYGLSSELTAAARIFFLTCRTVMSCQPGSVGVPPCCWRAVLTCQLSVTLHCHDNSAHCRHCNFPFWSSGSNSNTKPFSVRTWLTPYEWVIMFPHL